MTREEAIQALKDLLEMNVRHECDDKWINALDIAISALSAESETLSHEEAWKQIGGDAEMQTIAKTPDYMQQSRHDDGKDLISRADAIDAICKVWCYTTYGMCPHDDGYCKGCDEIEAIDALPSADRPMGEWKRVETRTYKGECTNCGFRHIFMDGNDSQYRFCPKCGVRMKGGNE